MKNINLVLVRSLILKRKRSAHKGDFGHVLLLAGSRGMAGAARLCAGGALRGGAGLVTVGIAKGLYPVVGECLRPEAMVLLLPENTAGGISHTAFAKIKSFVKKRGVTCIVAGPGMGNTADTAALTRKIISCFDVPVVLDADALNSLAGNLKVFQNARAKIIVTPHPGEMARLAVMMPARVQGNRESVARLFSKRHKLICVLKGAGTVVSDGENIFINTTGNPGMATGGCGDVLAGLIGALTSQVKDPKNLNAALAGVFIHGRAGDLAAKEKTEMSMLAGDIVENIPKALK
jgi:NAD(P)H-hydrate epimerase